MVERGSLHLRGLNTSDQQGNSAKGFLVARSTVWYLS
jgi:hypothetical protein